MVNHKLAWLAWLAAAVVAAGAAADPAHLLDQRQNGTENYRVHVDGVVLAVAPADSLLAAASELDVAELLALSQLDAEQHPPAGPSPAPAPPAPKSLKKGLMRRLTSLLLPLLKQAARAQL